MAPRKPTGVPHEGLAPQDFHDSFLESKLLQRGCAPQEFRNAQDCHAQFRCVQTGARQQRLALQDLGNCFVDRSHMSFYNFLGVDITRVIIKVTHEIP